MNQHVYSNVWNRGHFPEVITRNKQEVKEEITKVYMTWFRASEGIYRVKWEGSLSQLLEGRNKSGIRSKRYRR